MSSKLITVFGATGTQGGSVAQSLLANKVSGFSVRALSRNIDSDKSKALAAQGAQLFKADQLVKEDVAKALAGSWGLFLNLNSEDPSFHEPNGPKEKDVGKAIVDLAFDAGVQHLVYSALPSAAEITNGKFPRYDFDAKNAIAEHAKTKGFKSFARVSPGWYYENHIDPEFAVIFNSFPFTADADGVYNFTMPRWGEKGHGVPWVSILEDYGDFVHGVFLNPEQYNGQFIQGFSHLGSFEDFVEGFAKHSGKKAQYTPDDINALETHGDFTFEAFKGVVNVLIEANANYYGLPLDVSQAKELKAKAAVAKGQDPEAEESKLMSIDAFWKKYF